MQEGFFSLVFSIGIVILTYLIAEKLFNKNTAIISSLMVSFSSVVFHHGFHLYVDIPAAFFVLLATWFFINKKYLLTGLFTGFACLTKFPAGIFIVIFALLAWKKSKGIKGVISGFLIAVLPYLTLNFIWYGSFIQPLIDAKIDINRVLICPC